MAEDNNKQEFKKNFPSSFIWFLIAAFFLALLVQNLVDTKQAKVSFSYQLEPLVNLQLIQPEESKKTAINDNLVTFSGRFRERRTEEGKIRYKYLELLNASHQLQEENAEVQEELSEGQGKVKSTAEWFLRLSGIPVPKGGYIVVRDLYTYGGNNASVVLDHAPEKNIGNLVELKTEFSEIQKSPSEKQLLQFGNALSSLIHKFRSPMLGIGDPVMKQTLKDIDREVTQANSTNFSLDQRSTIYGNALTQLTGIVNDLNQFEDQMRLSKLRSVRSYKQALEQEILIAKKLEENQIQLEKARHNVANVIWFYNNQELSTRSLEKQDPEQLRHWFQTAKEEWNAFPQNRGAVFRAPDQPLNSVLERTFKSEEPTPNYFSYLITFLPLILVLMVLYFLFSRQMKGMGNSALNFGKSTARLLNKDQHKMTFKDVAGIDEAIEELQEIVEFLKSPQKFTTLGGRIPKGVLCIGPPGTGKTLIAKAVAGEADRPFFSISGSEFVEMFVGVGASRIRDLFNQAKQNAPCIVFIDEIDAVGRHRGAGIGGGHDEREQTLNQLLVEMDGFDTNDGVILMAATNRPDVLDKALLRPGRFDRRVMIDLPDIKGRFDILKVHARNIKMDPSVDLMSLARSTPGCSGADLANLLNEAALLAARRGAQAVAAKDAFDARDKVLYGKERHSLEIDENEKKTTAFHESGHAVVGMCVENSDPIDKVTIIPRGFSLGATMFLPEKNRLSFWKKEALDKLAVLMGGRVAEEIFIGDVSSGARQDFEQATTLAKNMVCQWGMSDNIGLATYSNHSNNSSYIGMTEKDYSEETQREIDKEVRKILEEAHHRAVDTLQEHRKEVEVMANALIRFETLTSEDVQKIMKGEFNEDLKMEELKKSVHPVKKSPASPPPPPIPEKGKGYKIQPPTQITPDVGPV